MTEAYEANVLVVDDQMGVRYTMKAIYKTLKYLIFLTMFSLVITGCGKSGDAGARAETSSSSETSKKKEESKQVEKEDEKSSEDEPGEESEEPDEHDEEPYESIYSDHSDMKFGKFSLNGISENNNMVTLVVEEYVIVTEKDKELIRKYGLPEDLNGYDYEMVSISEPDLICAFKTECPCIMFDYEKMEASKVDWDTFGDHMFNMEYSHYDEESKEYILEDGGLREIWAYYTVDEDGFMTNIEEIYIP